MSYDAYLSGELRRYATESSSSQHSVTAGFESVIEKHPRRGATVCPFYGFGAGVSLRNSRERETDTRVESRRNNSNEFVVSDSSLSTTRNTTTDWTTYGLASGGVELGISRTITFATEYRVLVSYRYRDSSEDRTGSNSYDHRLSEDHRYYRSRVVDVRLGSLQSFVTVRL